jgi:hypothetical protein
MKKTRERLDRVRAMINVGIVTRERACDSKQSYPNRNDARHAAKGIFAKTGRETATYRCEFCGLWHITKFRHGEEAA